MLSALSPYVEPTQGWSYITSRIKSRGVDAGRYKVTGLLGNVHFQGCLKKEINNFPQGKKVTSESDFQG